MRKGFAKCGAISATHVLHIHAKFKIIITSL